MCGIAGIIDLKSNRPIPKGILETMTHGLVHRGPDESGFFIEPGVGLGHRRLSIIDLSSGQQPFASEDGQIIVTYNGEIYNFREVADALREKGYRFRTRCDTEVIVYAWAEWGAACVDHFRGMFAFVIYDKRSQSVFAARDRLGIKPFYYAILDDFLVFGSELKAILAHPDCPRAIAHDAVEDYFAYGYVPDPKSILSGVAKLAPGHHFQLQRGRSQSVHPTAYWDLTFRHRLDGPIDQLGEELIERLTQAVEVRMVADVPLGAFLSGGVDSSAVVALMADLSDAPVNTCSIGFDAADHDETRYACDVARRYDCNHRTRIVDPDDFDLVDRLAGLYDEPFADSSAMPTYRVCELARENVVVALSGDGGDELFAGYRRHRWHDHEEKLRAFLPQSLRSPLFGTLGRLYPKLDWAPKFLRAKTTFQALAMDSAEAYFHTVSVMPDALRKTLFSERFHHDLNGYSAVEVMRGHMMKAPADDPLSMVQYADFKSYLPGDILTKVDRASMAHSLEVRVPILDHHFLGWATGIAPALRLQGRQGKYIFKKALEDRVPHDTLYRPKMGFAVPLAKWFRGPLKERVESAISSEILLDTGYFERASLRRLFERHVSGINDYSSALWSLLMFESSLRNVLAR